MFLPNPIELLLFHVCGRACVCVWAEGVEALAANRVVDAVVPLREDAALREISLNTC